MLFHDVTSQKFLSSEYWEKFENLWICGVRDARHLFYRYFEVYCTSIHSHGDFCISTFVVVLKMSGTKSIDVEIPDETLEKHLVGDGRRDSLAPIKRLSNLTVLIVTASSFAAFVIAEIIGALVSDTLFKKLWCAMPLSFSYPPSSY